MRKGQSPTSHPVDSRIEVNVMDLVQLRMPSLFSVTARWVVGLLSKYYQICNLVHVVDFQVYKLTGWDRVVHYGRFYQNGF